MNLRIGGGWSCSYCVSGFCRSGSSADFVTLTVAGIAFGVIVACALAVIVGVIAFQRGYKKGKRDK